MYLDSTLARTRVTASIGRGEATLDVSTKTSARGTGVPEDKIEAEAEAEEQHR